MQTCCDQTVAVKLAADSIDVLRRRLNAALLGKPDVVELLLAGLLANGHILVEDRPGLGKTTIAKALADAVAGRFSRVQCTPDLLPTDITGFNIFNQQTREFEFARGPVFCEVLLADEINRATPRTQSALFEAMAERQVSIDGVTYPLPETFFVIATQNPLDSHGVFPLPEAQLDRFAVKLQIGYPDPASESRMLAEDGLSAEKSARHHGEPALSSAQLAELQEGVRGLFIAPKLQEYLVQLAQWTREQPAITTGLSPRGLLTWQRLAKAWAFLNGRSFVLPDDIQAVALPTLALRLSGDFEDPSTMVQRLLAAVPVPVHGSN